MIGIKKFATTCLLTIFLVIGMAAPAFALDLDLSDARIDADEGGLTVEKIAGPNHFIKEEGLSPGTTITRSYIIQNTYLWDYDLCLYAENPIDTSNGYGLINKISLTLYLDDEKVYDGTLAGAIDDDGCCMIGENNISCGTITRNSSTRLTAIARLPGEELGNEFQGASAEVDWVFNATRTPTSEIPEPLGPGEVTTPGMVSPKTGDMIQIGIIVGIMLASLILLLYAKRRREKALWDDI